MSTEMVTISQTIPQLDQLPAFIEQTQLDGTDGKIGFHGTDFAYDSRRQADLKTGR